jgi:5-methylcytosine-specific restriction enzyme subunit McrC
LRAGQIRLIIDTKYYREALQERHGKRSLKSENLYQLFSYVKNAEAIGNAYSDVEGMLLYPVVGDRLDVNFEVQGHRLRAVTIDLAQPWQGIRSDLLGLLR